jgi:hypothetical protein
MSALADVRKYGNLPIPLKLTNKPKNGSEKFETNLPEKIKGRRYYQN